MSHNNNNFYFFGDSLSYSKEPGDFKEETNAKNCHGAQDPLVKNAVQYPYASNGPLWSAALSENSKYGQNFARCGAETVELHDQIAKYKSPTTTTCSASPVKNIYSFMSGGDDLIHNIPSPSIYELVSYFFTDSVIKNDAAAAAQAITSKAKVHMETALKDLVVPNTCSKTLLIANLPDLSITAAIRDPFGVLSSVQGQEFLKGTDTSMIAVSFILGMQSYGLGFIVQPVVDAINLLVRSFATDMVTMHNKNIAEIVQSHGATLLDMEGFAKAVVAHPDKFGLLNINDFCNENSIGHL